MPRADRLGGFGDQAEWHDIGLQPRRPLDRRVAGVSITSCSKDLAAENMIQFIVGDLTGTVWIADFTLTKKKRGRARAGLPVVTARLDARK